MNRPKNTVLDRSMTAGITLCLNYGILVALSIFTDGVWDFPNKLFIQLSFFVGTIIGYIVGLVLVDIVGFIKIQYASASCLMLCGLTNAISAAINNGPPFAMLVLSQAAAGIGFGLLYPVFIAFVGEQAYKSNRGKLVGLIPICLECGTLLCLLYSYIFNKHFSIIAMIAIVCCIVSAGSIFVIYKFGRESYIFYLIKADNEQALEKFCDLRQPLTERDIKIEFNEMSDLIKNDLVQTAVHYINIVPYIYLVLTRFTYLIVSNGYTFFSLINYIEMEFKIGRLFIIAIMYMFRIAVSVGTCLFIDKFGRKNLFQISCFATGVFMLVIGVIEISTNEMSTALIWIIFVIIIMCQSAIGVGIITIPDVLLSEIVPFKLRKTVFSVIYSLEAVGHIVFLILVDNQLYFDGVWLIWFIVLLLVTLTMHYVLPETTGKTIREIRDMIRA